MSKDENEVQEERRRLERMATLTRHFGTFTSLLSNDEIEAMEKEDAKSWTSTPKTDPPTPL